ncbi:MAG: flagellar protein FlgN [Zetaproteobacteria bacterium CG1_02_53_45]|nr:MAG: flagellar protein FlgN [Zetaproteobacteria bacterium CG1_02_53_45]
MVINQLSGDVLLQLRTLLEQMNVCAHELEKITQGEYEAIRSLNAERIIALSDHRIVAHQALAQLENSCRELMSRQGVDQSLTLEIIIDLHAGKQASDFQALRRNLYERIVKVDKSSQENHLRMHAAYNVSSSILQKLGLAKVEQTYGRR